MHSDERLRRILDRAPTSRYTGFAYRVIPEQYRDSPLSAIGAVQRGGRYNAPFAYPVLYSADSQLTAMLEAAALFRTADGKLEGVPRDPDLVLTIDCHLDRVLDLTVADLYAELGTSRSELISENPSRFILNARGEDTPTQQLGAACSHSGKISALKVPSAANADGYCLNILLDSMLVGEKISILSKNGLVRAEVNGNIPRPIEKS